MSNPTGDPFLLLEVLGTIAFAVSGGAVAVRAGMDWLGVVVLAVVAAIGGGTIRDVVSGDLPVSWVTDPWPVLVAIVAGGVVIAVGHRVPHMSLDSRTAVLVADAAGLAAFTVTGTLNSLPGAAAGSVAVLLGVVTGTGGGVLRDVLARERPLVLVGQIYALASVAGAAVVVVLTNLSVDEGLVRWIAVGVVLALRLAAVRGQWSLPRFTPADD